MVSKLRSFWHDIALYHRAEPTSHIVESNFLASWMSMIKNYVFDYDIEASSRMWKCFPTSGELERLPIFFQDQRNRRIYYSPGFVVMALKDSQDTFEAGITSSAIPTSYHELSSQLLKQAVQATKKLKDLLLQPFVPLCLTIYLINQCNLNCSYCFANSKANALDSIGIDAIQSALRLVARNCIATQNPLSLVFHGGGEPTLKLKLMKSIFQLADRMSEEAGISTFYYLATNGILSIENAQWVAHHFNMVGLSCDGPSFIQDKQRPYSNGSGSSDPVRRTATIIRDSGTRFAVRVTVTADSYLYQEEIADYICRVLRPDEIHVEPLYTGGRAGQNTQINPLSTGIFIEKYLKAREIAWGYGIPWLSSGSRPEEIHGPYCNILKGVLNLIPGGIATACFKTSTREETVDKSMSIGQAKIINGYSQFDIDRAHIRQLKKGILTPAVGNACKDCFNQYHCAKECPDRCLVENNMNHGDNDFRCSFQKMLATKAIFGSLQKIIDSGQEDMQGVIGGPVTSRI